MDPDGGRATIEYSGPETSRYRGPEGEVEFLATAAIRGGREVFRDGRPVEAIDLVTLRWASDGRPLAAAEVSRFTDAIRRHLRSTGKPFDLQHPSGEIEDETGRRRPGFRSALPRVEHSDGWRLTDLWMSPEHPDPAAPPPMIRYEDAAGAAEMPRRIAIRGDRRFRVLVPQQLRWVGARSGEAMTAEDRARILDRVRSAYDEWGNPYELEDTSY